MPRFSYLVAVLASVVAFSAQADIYKCVNGEGRVTYSNIPQKECKKIALEPMPPATNGGGGGGKTAAAKTPTPADFPVDKGNDQRTKDRRRILEGELSDEQKNLADAKKELEGQQGEVLPSERIKGGAINQARVEERMQTYRDRVSLHERNIEAIQNELSRVR